MAAAKLMQEHKSNTMSLPNVILLTFSIEWLPFNFRVTTILFITILCVYGCLVILDWAPIFLTEEKWNHTVWRFAITYLVGCLVLILSQTSPGFYVFAIQVTWKHYAKRKKCSQWFWKLNNSVHDLFIFKILLIAMDWNFSELHHYLSIKS